jgi:hypothetical protein
MRYRSTLVRGAVVLCGFMVGLTTASGLPVDLPKISLFQALQRAPERTADVVFADAKTETKAASAKAATLEDVARLYGKRVTHVQGVAVLEAAATPSSSTAKSLEEARAVLAGRYGGEAGLNAYSEGVRQSAKSLAATLPANARTFADLSTAQQQQAMQFFRAQPLAARAGALSTVLYTEYVSPSP